MTEPAIAKTPGQIAYEAECARWPRLVGGSLRPTWLEISQEARDSWEARPDAKRAYPPFGVSAAV